ncbi:MAG: outer membrane protein transport protein [Deltaproteobacteria bacterium]|nr:outer membrane protein transport protein [Deltaproteobacteria bacterium]
MKKLSLLFLCIGGAAHANGFLLNEFDAKAVGRGNASTATDVDPSSIYYNIGGLAVGEGTSFQLTGSLIQPNASYTDTSGSKTESNTPTQGVPGVFVSSRVHPMVAVGIGLSTPFGLAIKWPSTSPQADVIREQSLHTFFITPSVGLNLGSVVPGLSLGAGLDLVPATVELKQDVYFGTDRGSAHLGGTGFGVGGRFGVMYRPVSQPALSLGAMYRTPVKENFSGTGNFDAPSPYRGQLPPDGDIKTSITLPQQVSAGAAYAFIPDLEVEANVVWTNWSQFKTLNIDVPASMGTGTMTISQPENYQDKFTFRVGGEYRMPHLGAAFRAGYIYDPTPVPATTLSAQLPDIDRNDVTLGASKSFGSYAAHLGVLWVLPASRKTSDATNMPQYKGSYDVSAFVASLTLSGHFSN